MGGFDKLRRAWRRRLGLWPHGDKSQWWRSGGGGGGVWGCTTVVQKEGGIATERGREGQSTAFSFWERIGGEGGGGREAILTRTEFPNLWKQSKPPQPPSQCRGDGDGGTRVSLRQKALRHPFLPKKLHFPTANSPLKYLAIKHFSPKIYI